MKKSGKAEKPGKRDSSPGGCCEWKKEGKVTQSEFGERWREGRRNRIWRWRSKRRRRRMRKRTGVRDGV